MDARERTDKGARALLVVASVVIVIAGIKAAAGLILPFLVSLFLALITLPLLNWLRRRNVPNILAVPTTLLAALSVLVTIVLVIGGSIKSFTASVPRYKVRIEELSTGLLDQLQARGINLSEQITTDLVNPSAVLDLATGTLASITSVLSNLVLVLLTIVLIMFEAAGFPDKLQAAFGRQSGSDRYEKIRNEIQLYLGIKTLVSLLTGLLVTVALALLGVDFPLLWGLLAFLLNYIPTLGSIIAAVPPVLLSLIQLGAIHALVVGVIFLSVNMILGNFVEPYFMGRRLNLSTLVVFLSLVFWGWVWGPVGMLLSVPLTMIVKIMLENTPDLRWIAVLLSPNPSHEGSVAPAGRK